MSNVIESNVIERRDDRGVVTLTFNRPEQLNALNREFVTELHEILARLADDRSCRVVVLTGAGRGFCAGLDLRGYGGAPGGPGDGPDERGAIQRGLEVQRQIVGLAQRIRRMPQIVIAAVNGPAAGGGLALVMASDIRIAADSAVFAVAFIKLGISSCDIGTSWMLPRLIGAGRAHELMLTGRRFGADEALRIGLLADAVPLEDLAARVETTIDALFDAPQLALSLTKQGMWLSLEIPSFDAAIELENRQQVLAGQTRDSREALMAFVAHRPPAYTNA